MVGFLNLFWVAHVYKTHGDIPVTSIPGLGTSWEEPESAVMRPRFILREGGDFLLLPGINQSHDNLEDALLTRSPISQGGT